jgi:stearoyl-CoA desaturase (delta-9 desaturase)
MGESYHNNHHAFPGSANFALEKGQLDVGWLVLKKLEKLGLVWDLIQPEDLPVRSELKRIDS